MDLDSFLEVILGQGIFAVMFVWIFHTTKLRNDMREDRLLDALDSLKDAYHALAQEFKMQHSRQKD